MPTIVRSGGGGGADISALTNAATASEVLSGRQFFGAGSDEPQEGIMVNHGALTNSVNVGETCTGSGGYYSSITVKGPTFSESTGGAEDILSGKKFYSNTGAVVSGTIKDKGAVAESVAVNGEYNGGAGYYSSITITGPTFTESTGTASDILQEKKFYSNSGQLISGSMTNKGAVTGSVGVGGKYTGDAGYYSSITVTGPTFSESTGSAGDILSGKKFYSNTGALISGTMTNYGSKTQTIQAGSSVTLSTGYYTTTKITAAMPSGAASKYKVITGLTLSNTWEHDDGHVDLGSTGWDYVVVGYQGSYNDSDTDGYWGTYCLPGIKYYLNGRYVEWCTNGSMNISKTNRTAKIIAIKI